MVVVELRAVVIFTDPPLDVRQFSPQIFTPPPFHLVVGRLEKTRRRILEPTGSSGEAQTNGPTPPHLLDVLQVVVLVHGVLRQHTQDTHVTQDTPAWFCWVLPGSE